MENHLFHIIHCCEICTHNFNNDSRKPLILPCGHTICLVCNNKIQKFQTMVCPFDKANHKVPGGGFPVNFAIANSLPTQTKDSKICVAHKELLNFYCASCKILVCQYCLIESSHLKDKHEVQDSKEVITALIVKENFHTAKTRLDSIESDYKKMLDDFEEFKAKEINALSDLNNEIIQYFKKEANARMELLENDILKKREYMQTLATIQEELNKNTNKINNDEKIENIDVLKNIIDKALTTQNDLNPPTTILNCKTDLIKRKIFKEIEDIFKNEPIPQVSQDHDKLIRELKEERGIKSIEIENVFRKIDRKNYVSQNYLADAYANKPLQIGWNTTISQPYMHAYTLEKLKKNLQIAKKALDIGIGSGFMVAGMASLMPKGSEIYGLEHIEDIIKFAKNNINKGNSNLFERNKIHIILKDGRFGHEEAGLFDVIHVGGAIETLPPQLLNQLAPGGRLFAPLGHPTMQYIFIYDKTLDGEIKKTKLQSVRYASLCASPQEQNPIRQAQTLALINEFEELE